MLPMSKLVLVDGHALFHRAFHAMPPLTTSKGELVNAVFGFTSMLLRVLGDIKPEYAIVAFDTKAPTFRHTQYTAYKAHRIAAPEEMHQQLPRVKEVVDSLNIPIFTLEGYEADDIIGTLASQASNQEVFIVTGDRDALQLVNTHIKAYMPGKSLSDIVIYDGKKFEDKYGFKPKQLIDYKALVGDQSDNIPGVLGVGPKTATDLLVKYRSVEGIYEHISEVGEKVREKLIAGKDKAIAAKKLIALDTTIELGVSVSDLEYKPNIENVIKELEELGFKSIVAKLMGKSVNITETDDRKNDNGNNQLELI